MCGTLYFRSLKWWYTHGYHQWGTSRPGNTLLQDMKEKEETV